MRNGCEISGCPDLAFVDSNDRGYCGIGTYWPDDRAGAGNGNNSGPGNSRVDVGCWKLPKSGTFTLLARAADRDGNAAVSKAVTIRVTKPG